MFIKSDDIKPFEAKVWLATPTMHGDEIKYITEAYESNWMSTVGRLFPGILDHHFVGYQWHSSKMRKLQLGSVVYYRLSRGVGHVCLK